MDTFIAVPRSPSADMIDGMGPTPEAAIREVSEATGVSYAELAESHVVYPATARLIAELERVGGGSELAWTVDDDGTADLALSGEDEHGVTHYYVGDDWRATQ